MSKKMIVTFGENVTYDPDFNDGDLCLYGDNLEPPSEYEGDWLPCPPLPRVSAAAAAKSLVAPGVNVDPGIELSEGKLTVHASLLTSPTVFVPRTYSLQAALPVGQVVPSVRFGVRFKVSAEAPGTGGDRGSVQFGISNSSATIALEVVRDTDGALKTFSYLNGVTLASTTDAMLATLDPTAWYEAHFSLELRDNSGAPAGVLKRKILTYPNELEPPTAIAVYSDINITFEQYQEISNMLREKTSLYLIGKDDSLAWSIDLETVYL